MAEKKVDLSIKDELLEKGELIKYSFYFFDYFYRIKKGKFKGKKVLIKRVRDSNTITKKSYENLIIFSVLTNSFPLIIADNYNIKNKLKKGAYYKFKEISMMREETFLELMEEGKLYFFHQYSTKLLVKENDVGDDIFNEETFNNLKREFEKIKKEVIPGLIEIKKLVHYAYKDFFIKEVNKFEIKKENKIIDFANRNSKPMIYLSKTHINPIEKDNIIIYPKKKLKSIKELSEILESFFKL